MKKLYSLVILFVLLITNVFAQKFTHSGNIEPVKVKSFYQIHLPNELRQFAQQNLSDVRILDKNKNQIPYKQNVYNFQQEIKGFSELKYSNDHNSVFIIEKGDTNYWNSFILKIKNNALTKQYTLSGSNDNENWYAITDTNTFTLSNNMYSSETYQLIEFPQVDYQFIKLIIDNSVSAPINVLAIGCATSTFLDNYFDKITPKKYELINDSANKTTIIHIQFDEPQQIDKFKLSISSPTYFLREANLHKKVSKLYKNKMTPYRETISLFEINSKGNLQYEVNVFEKDFYIEISNFDNQPLQIDSIEFFQTPYFLVAELSHDNHYQVLCGDKSLAIPNYDIGNFNELNNVNIPQLHVFQITDLRGPKRPEVTLESFLEQKWFMWVCIGIGAIVLAVFSVSLMKNIRAKEGDE
ncbi:MAG: hypothetical protein ACOYMA_10290 [Bacteroidia bacterium]